jgi:CelD/BcsL family acetyltransferase involved in cellulose biosynthesis
VNVELHTTPGVFETLAGEWDGLLSPDRSDNLFSTRLWQSIWWKHMRRGDLAILTARDADGSLGGIAPWFVEQSGDLRVVRFIGCTEIVDYLDLLLRPDCAMQTVDALLEFMMSPQAPVWDRFELCNIPASSDSIHLLTETTARLGLLAEVELAEVCPVIDLPDTYEAYLGELDKKQRHELRRKRRRAEEEGAEFVIAGSEHDIYTEIQAFLDLMSMSTPEKAAFLQLPGHRAFFEEMGPVMYQLGVLDLTFLMVQGQRAATMWQFNYRDRVMLYNSGLNPDAFAHLSAGIVLLSHSIENAIEQGFRKYDFLRGDETYKFRLGARPISVFRVNIMRS